MWQKIRESLNIIGTIAAKDIVDAIKNREVLLIIIGAVFMLLLPQMLAFAIDPPEMMVAVLDQGGSDIIEAMTFSPDLSVVEVSSIDELEKSVSNYGMGLGVRLGVVLPTDSAETRIAGEPLEMDGYVVWANRHRARALAADFEQRAEVLLGQPVVVHQPEIIVPQPDIRSLTGMFLYSISSVTLVLLGITLVPYLMFEEKQGRTLDALLVSPVSLGEVATGKAMAGMFYMFIICSVMFAGYWQQVVNWEVMLLFTLSASLLTVAMGLMFGSLLESGQQLIVWMMLVAGVMIGSQIVFMMDVTLPTAVLTVINWLPSTALSRLSLLVFAHPAPLPDVLLNMGIVLISTLPFFVVTVLALRRSTMV